MTYKLEYSGQHICTVQIIDSEKSRKVIDDYLDFRGIPEDNNATVNFLTGIAEFIFQYKMRPFGKGEKYDWDEGWAALNGENDIEILDFNALDFDESELEIYDSERI